MKSRAFVVTTATDKAQWVALIPARNESVTLSVLVRQRHDPPHLVEGRVFQLAVFLHCREPLFDCKRLNAERETLAAPWQQTIA